MSRTDYWRANARGRLCHACGRAAGEKRVVCGQPGSWCERWRIRVVLPATAVPEVWWTCLALPAHLARAYSVRIRRRGRTLRRHRRRV